MSTLLKTLSLNKKTLKEEFASYSEQEISDLIEQRKLENKKIIKHNLEAKKESVQEIQQIPNIGTEQKEFVEMCCETDLSYDCRINIPEEAVIIPAPKKIQTLNIYSAYNRSIHIDEIAEFYDVEVNDKKNICNVHAKMKGADEYISNFNLLGYKEFDAIENPEGNVKKFSILNEAEKSYNLVQAKEISREQIICQNNIKFTYNINCVYYDIETYNNTFIDDKIPMPLQEDSHISIISLFVPFYNDIYEKQSICYIVDHLEYSSIDPKIEIIKFADEQKMCTQFMEDLYELQSRHIIWLIGFNSNNEMYSSAGEHEDDSIYAYSYDLPFIIHKTEQVQLFKIESCLTKVSATKSIRNISKIRSYNNMLCVDLIIIFQFIKNRVELENNKLKTILDYLGCEENKFDVSFRDLHAQQTGHADAKELIEYCMEDSFVLDLAFKKLGATDIIKFYMNTYNISESMFTSGNTSKFNEIIAQVLHDKNIHVDYIDKMEKEIENDMECKYEEISFTGGYLKQTDKTDIYALVASLDFKSMYPSIIVSMNIGINNFIRTDFVKEYDGKEFHTIYENGTQSFIVRLLHRKVEHYFRVFYDLKIESIYSEMMNDCLNERAKVRALMKTEKDSAIVSVYDSVQLGYKEFSNSIYGALGCTKDYNKFENPFISATVTACAQYYLKMCIANLEAQNINCLYSVTDSIYFSFDKPNVINPFKVQEKINEYCKELYLIDYKKYDINYIIEFEFEKIYENVLFIADKAAKYSGVAMPKKDITRLLDKINNLQIGQTLEYNSYKLSDEKMDQLILAVDQESQVLIEENIKVKNYYEVKEFTDFICYAELIDEQLSEAIQVLYDADVKARDINRDDPLIVIKGFNYDYKNQSIQNTLFMEYFICLSVLGSLEASQLYIYNKIFKIVDTMIRNRDYKLLEQLSKRVKKYEKSEMSVYCSQNNEHNDKSELFANIIYLRGTGNKTAYCLIQQVEQLNMYDEIDHNKVVKTIYNQIEQYSENKYNLKANGQILQVDNNFVRVRLDQTNELGIGHQYKNIDIYDLHDFVETNRNEYSIHEVIPKSKEFMKICFDIDADKNLDSVHYMQLNMEKTLNKFICDYFKNSIKFSDQIYDYKLEFMRADKIENGITKKISYHIISKEFKLSVFSMKKLAEYISNRYLTEYEIEKFCDLQIYETLSLRVPLSKKHNTSGQLENRSFQIGEYHYEDLLIYDYMNECTLLANNLFDNAQITKFEFDEFSCRSGNLSPSESDETYAHLCKIFEQPKLSISISEAENYSRYILNGVLDCKFCKVKHDNDIHLSIEINEKSGNRYINIKCLREVGHQETKLEFNDSSRTVKEEKLAYEDILKQKIERIPTDHKICDEEQKINEEYLDLQMVKSNECLFIKSCLGSGKTENIICPNIKNDQNKYIVSIGCRRTLNNYYVEEFGFECYEDLDGKINLTEHNKIQIEYESLQRLCLENERIDLLIIDEIESVQNLFNRNSAEINMQLNICMFIEILQNTDKIIICDGLLEENTYQMIKELTFNMTHIVINNYYKIKNSFIDYYVNNENSLKFVQRQIIEQLQNGMKIAIATTSVNEELSIIEAIKEMDGERGEGETKIYQINGEDYSQEIEGGETMKEKKDNLKNVNLDDILVDYQVLMFTSSITAGISITLPFDIFYNIYQAKTCSVVDNIEMAFRCRRVPKIVYVVSKNTNEFKFEHNLTYGQETSIELCEYAKIRYNSINADEYLNTLILLKEQFEKVNICQAEQIEDDIELVSVNIQDKLMKVVEELTIQDMKEFQLRKYEFMQDPKNKKNKKKEYPIVGDKEEMLSEIENVCKVYDEIVTIEEFFEKDMNFKNEILTCPDKIYVEHEILVDDNQYEININRQINKLKEIESENHFYADKLLQHKGKHAEESKEKEKIGKLELLHKMLDFIRVQINLDEVDQKEFKLFLTAKCSADIYILSIDTVSKEFVEEVGKYMNLIGYSIGAIKNKSSYKITKN